MHLYLKNHHQLDTTIFPKTIPIIYQRRILRTRCEFDHKQRSKERESLRVLTLTVLARVEGLAGHLEECVQRTALPRGSLAVLASVGAVLLWHFPLELLLLRLLERRMMQAGMNARVMKRGVMMVMMGERVRATGIRHGASSGRRGAAEGRLADGAGHRRE